MRGVLHLAEEVAGVKNTPAGGEKFRQYLLFSQMPGASMRGIPQGFGRERKNEPGG
jgi:hypothetical protein